MNRSFSSKKEEFQNTINTKILDSIIDDDEEKFTELVLQIKGENSNPNKELFITNYKFPEILSYRPTFASVCALFNAEKCFSSLSTLCPEGPSSENFKKADIKKRSPIHFACFGGNMNIIRQLYQFGFNLEEMDEDGFQPSHYAAMSGNLDVIKYLLTKGAVDLIHVYRTTPLSIACLYGHINIVKFYYENPDLNCHIFPIKEVNYKNKKTSLFHLACEGGHDDVLNYILSNNIEYAKKHVKKTDYLSRTPMNVACQNGSLSCIKLLVNFDNFNFNSESYKKHVSLIDAVEGGFLDVVQFLLKQKTIDINMKNSNDLTALNVAIIKNQIDIVEVLIQNGATKNFRENDFGNLFLIACGTYNIEMIKFLDKKFEIPYQKMGDTFIKQACKIEYEDLILFLIKKKCNLSCINANDFNYRRKWNKFMSFLQKNGLDFSNMKLADGTPIIIHAIKGWGSFNSVKELISHGVALNVDIINENDLVNYACHVGNIELFMLLMNYNPKMEDIDKLMKSLTESMDYNIRNGYKDKIKDCNQIAELLLRDHKANPNDQSVLIFLACHLLLDTLAIFGKYGADFNKIVFICPSMISEKIIPLIDFLRERNIDLNKLHTNYNTSLIVEAFRNCESALTDKLFYEGAILTKEMIENHKLVQIACQNGKFDLFSILISYEPSINNPTSYIALLLDHFEKPYLLKAKIKLDDACKIIEILLRDYNANCNDELIINYCSQECFLEFLELFVKYGANFSNCRLDYERMYTKEHLKVFHFLEKNGCKFHEHKHLSNLFYWPNWDSGYSNRNDDLNEIPIEVNIKNLLWQNDYDIGTFLFLIKHTSNDDLINFKTEKIYEKKNGVLYMKIQDGNQNIVDILLIFDKYQAILDLYKKLDQVLLPLLLPNEKFKEMIDNSDIQDLKDMISNAF